MRVVLDFDRVLFDTDRFKKDVEAAGITVERGTALLEAVDEAGIDWSSYVYPEALEYLQHTTDEVHIVSSYHSRYSDDNAAEVEELMTWQREKIMKCGIGALVDDRLHVVGKEKIAKLQELKTGQSEIVVVDDEADHVRAAKQLGYVAFWFRTPKNLLATTPERRPEHVEGVTMINTFAEFTSLRKETYAKAA